MPDHWFSAFSGQANLRPRRSFYTAALASCVVLFLELAPATWLPAQPAPATGNAKRGREAFNQYCVTCHGPRGMGDGPMAQATTPPAPPLNTKDVRALSDEALLAIIADGKGVGMPAWRGLLGDQDLRDVVAYVRSLGG